jgi:hypothetical protein
VVKEVLAMAKFKPVKAGKKAPRKQGMIPCLILLITGMALLFLLFWSMMRSGTG